ncbi:MAG: hypothetical protein J6Z35_11635, partial [Lachnospiraceae bacterium]|nr:hypothetical protein [Lachnospiraceae bacterium]
YRRLAHMPEEWPSNPAPRVFGSSKNVFGNSLPDESLTISMIFYIIGNCDNEKHVHAGARFFHE